MKTNKIRLDIIWETEETLDAKYNDRVQCAIGTALHSLDIIPESATFVLSAYKQIMEILIFIIGVTLGFFIGLAFTIVLMAIATNR